MKAAECFSVAARCFCVLCLGNLCFGDHVIAFCARCDRLACCSRRSAALQKPRPERREDQDDSHVDHQALPEVVLEEQDVYEAYGGHEREHIDRDGRLPAMHGVDPVGSYVAPRSLPSLTPITPDKCVGDQASYIRPCAGPRALGRQGLVW